MRSTAFALIAAALLAPWGGTALAQSPHDGAWAIEIVTEHGACERLYRYYVVVDGRTVRLRSMTGETSEVASGLVRTDGRIDATLGQADDPVRVTGHLGGSVGKGTWSAPARQCTGRWSAHKRA